MATSRHGVVVVLLVPALAFGVLGVEAFSSLDHEGHAVFDIARFVGLSGHGFGIWSLIFSAAFVAAAIFWGTVPPVPPDAGRPPQLPEARAREKMRNREP